MALNSMPLKCDKQRTYCDDGTGGLPIMGNTFKLLAVPVGALMLLSAACSDDGGSSKAASTTNVAPPPTSASSGGSAVTAAPTATTTAAVDGRAFTVMVIDDFT